MEHQAVQRVLHTNATQLEASSATAPSSRFSHDFSQIPMDLTARMKTQPQLTVSTARDVYEQEADRVADQLMHQQVGREPFQIKPVRERDAGEMSAPAIVQQAIASPGRSLDSTTREWMESRFGHDFSRVRVHADTTADLCSRSLNARAFTVGQDIFFGAGEYTPGNPSGQKLIAHELTHVVQQGQAAERQIQRQKDVEKPPRFKRVPPGPGAFTEAEYRDWLRRHPNRAFTMGGPWDPKSFYERYTPDWFWSRGYFYSGSVYGGYLGAYSEVWLNNEGNGKEFRVFRAPETKSRKPRPTPKPPSPTSAKEPSSGPVIEGIENWPTQLDPNADREALFGPVIAARENVDAAFGAGDVVLYDDGTAELFLEGTTQSYVFRPHSGGGYIVYGPDGRRLEMIWMIPEEDIPDPDTDAVE